MQLDNVFQFHKGAIRTLIVPYITFFPFSFNSIKVRLEPKARISNMLRDQSFNSIKVRLERVSFAFQFGSGSFQFHKGAIRTNIIQRYKASTTVSIP